MNFVLRMAWRESRAAWGKFLFFLLSVAIGVGSLAGVKGFAAELLHGMYRQSRSLLAADLSLSTTRELSSLQKTALGRIRSLGWPMAAVTTTTTVVNSPQSTDGLLVELKAVEPNLYPFYGKLEVDAGAAGAILAEGKALVAPELLERLGIKVGDTLKIGNTTAVIGAQLLKEPDRTVAGFSLGPRLMIAQSVLDKAGLIQPGARVTYQWLIKTPEDLNIDAARRMVGRTAGLRVQDYRDAQATVRRFLTRASDFLSLVALLSLLVGGLGVAHTIAVFLQQKRQNIAILRCMGATGNQIMAVYLSQAMALAVAGSALGVGVGLIVQAIMPRIIGPLLQLDTPLTVEYGPALQGLLLGLIVALAFSLLPLLQTRRVKPAVLLRREVDTPGGHVAARWAGSLAVALGMGLLFGCLGAWLSGSWKYGFFFVGGLWATLGVLAGAAWLLLWIVRHLPPPRRLTAKHGLHNLYRPGSQAVSVVMAVGTGIAVTLCVYLLQTNLLQEMLAAAPANTPNVVFIGLPQASLDEFKQYISAAPGAITPAEVFTLAQSRIATVDGKPVISGQSAQTSFTLTTGDHPPDGQAMVAGRWWTDADKPAWPLLSVEERSAQALHIHVGSTVTFDVSGKTLTARVLNLRRGERPGPDGAFQMILTPGALAGFSTSYAGTVRMQPGQVGALIKSAADRFPSVTVVDIGSLLVTLQSIFDRLSLMIRFMASFAIVAGLIILAGSIVATKYRRVRETAMLKVLGATRATVAGIFTVEYGVLGLVAGAVGAVAAALAAAALLRFVLDAGFFFKPVPLLVGVLGTAALTIATGFAASLDLLNRKPLVVLREE